ncbi:hypothetical protein ES708_23061 [subsurface metagenome]
MKKKKRGFEIDGTYSVIEHKLADSEAFKDLNLSTKWLYMEFKFRFHGDNERHIIFTYKEAIKIMNNITFIKSRDRLLENGLIDIVKRGGFNKEPTIYGLSDRWKKFGTKEFVKFNRRKIKYL